MRNIFLSLLLVSPLVVFAQTDDNRYIKNDSVYLVCEKSPEYQSGLNELFQFINDNLIYPENYLEEGIQGEVIVQLTIEKDGTIEEMDLLDNPDYYLSQEAVRVLSLTSGKWIAGEIGGKKVRSYFTVPVIFRIKEEPIYIELKSHDPVACPEKEFEFIGGTQAMGKFFNNNMRYPDEKVKGKTTARVVVRKSKPTLEIEVTKKDNVSAGNTRSMINTSRGRYPTVLVGGRNIEGQTLVRFVIEKDRSVSNATIVETKYDKSNDIKELILVQALEAELIRLIYLSAGKWMSAEVNCEKVRASVTMPVDWKLITNVNRL